MHGRPRGVPIFLVIGVGIWVVVSLAAAVAVLQAPAENGGLAIGIVLLWIVLLVFVGVERWTGGRRAG